MSENEKEYIFNYFVYHSDGTIERKDRKNSNGSYDKDGYLILKIKGKQYKAHRIVWLLNKGYYPEKEIDHINRNRKDNRIENLREVDRITNILNREVKVNKDTGVEGIYIDRTTKGLKAVYSFHFQGKSYRFRNLEEAISKRRKLRNEYLQEIS